jgi:hypothetical protein
MRHMAVAKAITVRAVRDLLDATMTMATDTSDTVRAHLPRSP